MKVTYQRSMWIAISVAIIIILIDQTTKAFMLAHPDILRTGQFFELYVTTNEGIAFSIPLKGTLLYILLIILTVISVIYGKEHLRHESPLTGIVIGLVAGGGLGNVIDRIQYGHVIDFIKVGTWPLFNVADAAISIAVCMLFIWHKSVLQNPEPTSGGPKKPS